MQAAIDAGLEVDDFAPRLAFFFNGHNNVFQEVAKFRAARRMWAHIMRERFGAQDPKSLKLRFHTQTGGVTLTAQQPENNIVRVALQGFAAVCGGTQSLHTNGYDEALALPTERAAKIALRTQQIIAHESGAADTVDPFAGSYFVEALTDEIESRAQELIAKVDELGGSVNAIAFITGEIEESAWGYQERYRIEPGHRRRRQQVRRGRRRGARTSCASTRSPSSEQVERLKAFKADRDQELVDRRLEELREAARGTRQPAAPHPRGAARPRLDGRGLRRDARRLRRVRSRRSEVRAGRASRLRSFYDVVVAVPRHGDPASPSASSFAYPFIETFLLRQAPEAMAAAAPARRSTSPACSSRPLRRSALVAGIYLASDRDYFSEVWVQIPFAILIVLLGLHGGLLHPDREAPRRRGRGGVTSPAYQALVAAPRARRLRIRRARARGRVLHGHQAGRLIAAGRSPAGEEGVAPRGVEPGRDGRCPPRAAHPGQVPARAVGGGLRRRVPRSPPGAVRARSASPGWSPRPPSPGRATAQRHGGARGGRLGGRSRR